MIDAISLKTAHLLGDALPAAHRLRYDIFVERQKYDVPSWQGMEWDQFDTPAAEYLLWRDDEGRVRAVARLISTSRPYMIAELWPELVETGEVPASDDIWEVSRVGIDRRLDAATRARVLSEMFCALAEFGLESGVRAYVFVTPPRIIDAGLVAAGIDVRRLGAPKRLGRLPVVAAQSFVSHGGLIKLRRYHRIAYPVLRIAGRLDALAA
ncbi:MAG: autoinducer synthase [Rhodospirillales bacterium]|nr:autoinducer synthase [Rhodospirillales bacterium]